MTAAAAPHDPRRTDPAPTGSPPAAGDLVTVVVPAYNEERSISSCLDSLCSQTHRALEVLVVDGGSTDRTRSLVAEYAAVDPRVRLVDNPRRIPPAALNEAVAAMSAQWLVRVDAHATVPPDYVERVLTHLRTGRWGGVGGRKDGVGITDEGRAIAAVMGSPFGVGNSRYHHGTETGVVDHIPFGAYPREVIAEVGGWDETIPVNQDFEFDHRVRESGRELLFDPALRIAWECRQSIRALWRQYRRYGRGKAQVVRMHPGSVAARHLVAPGLVAAGAVALVLAPFRPRLAAAVVAPYAAVVVAGTVAVAPTVEGAAARRAVPRALVAMHVGWGLGFWEGMAGAVAHRHDERV